MKDSETESDFGLIIAIVFYMFVVMFAVIGSVVLIDFIIGVILKYLGV